MICVMIIMSIRSNTITIPVDGDTVGLVVGADVGNVVGADVGNFVGADVGDSVCDVGDSVGDSVGDTVGLALIGIFLLILRL